MASLAQGATHVSSSTISVSLSERMTAAHAEAASSSSPHRCSAGRRQRRPPSCSSSPRANLRRFKRVSGIFDAFSQRTFVVSDEPKTANLVKLSGNFLIMSVIESLGEAMALVGKAGVDKHQYLDILTSTLFGAPIYKTYGALSQARSSSPPDSPRRSARRTSAWC